MGDYLTPTVQHLPDSCQFRSHAIQCEYNWCLLFSMSKFGVVQYGTMAPNFVFHITVPLHMHTYKTHGKVAGVGSIQHRYHHALKLPAWGTINTNAMYYIPTPTRLDQQVQTIYATPMPIHTHTYKTGSISPIYIQHKCQYILYPHLQDSINKSRLYMQHQCQYIYSHLQDSINKSRLYMQHQCQYIYSHLQDSINKSRLYMQHQCQYIYSHLQDSINKSQCRGLYMQHQCHCIHCKN